MSEDLKREAGKAALSFVKPGMRLGIGTGSTAEAFIRELAPKVKAGLEIIGVPTSERTRALCEELSVPLTTLEETPQLDLTIDGADELDGRLNLIKGGGGALLREKIVAQASKSMIVIADQSKVVEVLGAYPLPIEVNRFGLTATRNAIDALASSLNLSGEITLRETDAGKLFETDGGHLIVDASFGRIPQPQALAVALNTIAGVVENGLFCALADKAIIAAASGVQIMEPMK
ncbi:ribose-5-phosphate isomerase RpiA [Pseudahrensia aquimaris]|uniref:Ribose-5-phosphate isomerase A n=1 Tax=Pseudahrensia aquimaris TaxID=744461 RepID=A0ABW3FMR5_9HYPH